MVLSFVDQVGQKFLHIFELIHATVEGIFLSIFLVFRSKSSGGGFPLQEFLRQIYFTAVEALFPVILIGGGIGLFSGLYNNAELLSLSGDGVITRIFSQIAIDAIGPLFISIIVIARSGTAVASELGTMKVNQEIDALRIMCRHPYSFLVFPRIFGGMVGVFCLGITFTGSLLLVLCLARYFSDEISPIATLEGLTQSWNLVFVGFFSLKYLCSSLAIFSIACQKGFSVERSSFEVPIVSSKAVLHSLYAVFVLQGLFNCIQYSTFFQELQ